MWLKQGAPEALQGLDKIDKDQASDRSRLRSALESSGAAIASLIHHSVRSGGKVKGFRPHVVGFLGYVGAKPL